MNGHLRLPRIIAGSFSDHIMRANAAHSPFDIFVNIPAQEIISGGVTVRLSKNEFLVFFALAARRGAVVSHEVLIDILYGDDPGGGPEYALNIVSLTIMRIRQKIKVFPLVAIRNELGRGYYLEVSAPQYLHEAAE